MLSLNKSYIRLWKSAIIIIIIIIITIIMLSLLLVVRSNSANAWRASRL